jgi:short-subunit dehydrogenase
MTTSIKRAIVTGGTSGFGQWFVSLLKSEGYTVFVLSRRKPMIAIDGVQYFQVDLSDPFALEVFVQDVLPKIEPISLIVNNAGSGVLGAWHQIPTELHQKQFQLLCFTPLHLMQYFAQRSKLAEPMTMITVTSLAARLTLPYLSAYSAAKAALSSYSRSQLLENRRNNWIFMEFQLGDLDTAFNASMQKTASLDIASMRVLDRMNELMKNAPRPDALLMKVRALLRRPRSGVFRLGSFFQCNIAILGHRLLPQFLFIRLLRAYYSIR